MLGSEPKLPKSGIIQFGATMAKKAESLVDIGVSRPRDTCQSGRSSILLLSENMKHELTEHLSS